jgi:prephenate dehydrogenase
MNGLNEQRQLNEFLSLAGPGFRDFTRIAASDPKVWRDIFASNKDELLAQSRHFRHALLAIEHAVAMGKPDDVARLIELASQTRKGWKPPAP